MTRSHFALAIVLVVVLLGIGGGVPVAAAANREHEQLVADIRILQEQTQLLQAQISALNETLRTVTGRLDEQAGAMRKAFADEKLLVDNMGNDLRVVREKVDETNVRVNSLSQDIEGIRLCACTVTPRPQLPPEAGGAAAPPAGGEPVVQVPPNPVPGNPGQSPSRLFETSQGDYMQGQYQLAITGFEQYIRSFPRSDQADDAQYYIGESYFAWGKYKEALDAYDQVIKNSPGSNTLPNVYYKKGMAFENLKQPDHARESWEFVVKTYPNSDAGLLAKQALDRLTKVR